MNRHLKAITFGLVIVLVLGMAGCRPGTPDTTDGRHVEFDTPEELPGEVDAWVEGIRDAGDPRTDWMVHGDEVYVAVARGEVPHPGYGVKIEEITYDPEGDVPAVIVRATYTPPEEGESYPQVIAYPVAVARFDVTELDGADVDEVDFTFDIDDSDEVAVEETTHNVVLYFATHEGWLERHIRPLQAEELTPELVAAEIMLGPETEALQRALPEDTFVSVSRDSDDPSLAIVDLSEEIHEVQGSTGEMLAIYSIVNTLVENDLGFTRVLITVEGEQTNLGHLDLSEPLAYDDVIVQESK